MQLHPWSFQCEDLTLNLIIARRGCRFLLDFVLRKKTVNPKDAVELNKKLFI